MAGKKRVTFAVGTHKISDIYTRDEKCPTQGVHTPYGSLFIASYSGEKWNSDAVKPYHQEILIKCNVSYAVKNLCRFVVL